MLLFQLIGEQTNIGEGTTSHILDISKNKQQMEEICKSFNSKYQGISYKVNFYINEIDTTKVKDSLTKEEIKKLW
jgi:hypothetical protein